MEKEHIYEAIGRAIRTRREALELTQIAVGDLVGLSRTSITNIECGRQSLLVDQLYKFAEVLKTTPAELLPAEVGQPPAGKAENRSSEANAWIEDLRRTVR